MFGYKIDYVILRMFAHDREIATEAELDARALERSNCSPLEAMDRLNTHIARFRGQFPLDPQLRYLDMGCGTGELTICLAALGCKNVTGVDVVPRNIDACESNIARLDHAPRALFVLADLNEWVPPEKYDVVLSFDALEHIDDPGHFLKIMANFVASDGVAIMGFGPLFYSPFGDHMSPFFRLPMPWRGLLFSERAVLRVRRECYRPSDTAERYQDIVGGLNLMRYSAFLRYVREAGWEFAFLDVNPRLRRVPLLHLLSTLLSRIPGMRDYCVFSVYAILRRATDA
jgi:SAM-dependent methyltransferase